MLLAISHTSIIGNEPVVDLTTGPWRFLHFVLVMALSRNIKRTTFPLRPLFIVLNLMYTLPNKFSPHQQTYLDH
jgi:hypothetical protein